MVEIRLILNIIISLLGAILLIINFRKRDKEQSKIINLSNLWIGIAIVIFTITSTYFSHQIDQANETKQRSLNKALQKEIKRNSVISEKNFHLNKFIGELDNKIEELYLLLDFNKTYTAEELDGLECYLKMNILNTSYSFKISAKTKKMPEDIKLISLDKTAVKNSRWNENPAKSSVYSPRSETSFVVLDLWFLPNNRPKEMMIKELNQSYFEIAISSKHKNLIKQIQINVNDWTIFNRVDNQIKWQDRDVKWLPHNNKQYASFYEENELGMKYYQGKINYMKEGIFYYTVSLFEPF